MSNILACYDLFRWVLVILIIFFLIKPTRIACKTTSRFFDGNIRKIFLLATKCSIINIKTSALAAVRRRYNFPRSAKYVINTDKD